MENFKKCSKCGRELPASEFWKNASTEDGLQTYCKECGNVYAKNRKKTPGGLKKIYSSIEKLSNLAESVRTVQKLAYGNKGKLFLYTALADMLPNYIRYFDGVVYTPHSANDVHSLLKTNNFLLDYKDELMESKSLRLNLFPDIKKHIPDNTNLSLWKVKDMQWIKDCPVPADEEFKRVAELWEVE